MLAKTVSHVCTLIITLTRIEDNTYVFDTPIRHVAERAKVSHTTVKNVMRGLLKSGKLVEEHRSHGRVGSTYQVDSTYYWRSRGLHVRMEWLGTYIAYLRWTSKYNNAVPNSKKPSTETQTQYIKTYNQRDPRGFSAPGILKGFTYQQKAYIAVQFRDLFTHYDVDPETGHHAVNIVMSEMAYHTSQSINRLWLQLDQWLYEFKARWDGTRKHFVKNLYYAIRRNFGAKRGPRDVRWVEFKGKRRLYEQMSFDEQLEYEEQKQLAPDRDEGSGGIEKFKRTLAMRRRAHEIHVPECGCHLCDHSRERTEQLKQKMLAQKG